MCFCELSAIPPLNERNEGERWVYGVIIRIVYARREGDGQLHTIIHFVWVYRQIIQYDDVHPYDFFP